MRRGWGARGAERRAGAGNPAPALESWPGMLWSSRQVRRAPGGRGAGGGLGGEGPKPRQTSPAILPRPCAMVVPDFELICEIMLVAEGFLEARLLARKFITLYTLCKELLSKQVCPEPAELRVGGRAHAGRPGCLPDRPAKPPGRRPHAHPGPLPTGSLRLGPAGHQVCAGGGRLAQEGRPRPGGGPGADEGTQGF